MDTVYVTGPISLTEIILPDKHLHIFGDVHTKAPHCLLNDNTISIDDFIEDIIINNSDKIIDFFLEIDFPNDLRNEKYNILPAKLRNVPIGTIKDDHWYLPSPDYLTDLYHKFYNCFQSDKRYCEYPNLRAHYTDIRSFGSLRVIMDYIQQVKKFHTEYLKYNYRIDLRKHMKTIVDDGRKIIASLPFSINDVYKSPKIEKQLDHISNDDIFNAIHNYFDSIIWNHLLTAEQAFRSYDELSTFEDIILGINALHSYATRLVDVYILGRMFRHFDSYTSKNIIIYVGDDHAKFITDFLLTLDDVRVGQHERSETADKDYQCLTMTVPLFE